MNHKLSMKQILIDDDTQSSGSAVSYTGARLHASRDFGGVDWKFDQFVIFWLVIDTGQYIP